MMYRIFTNDADEIETVLHGRGRDVANLALMAPSLTWLVHKAVPEGVDHHRVLVETMDTGTGRSSCDTGVARSVENGNWPHHAMELAGAEEDPDLRGWLRKRWEED